MQDKQLTDDEKVLLRKQDTRLVSQFLSEKLEKEAKKHWDLFYKRNETRFYKDRHWTMREFEELAFLEVGANGKKYKTLLEVGCGVGNLVLPLLESYPQGKLFIYACDLSPRAIAQLKADPRYSSQCIMGFECDITSENICDTTGMGSVDIVTLVFTLSAIHPDKLRGVLVNVREALRPGGLVLFRDYGLYDMAQLRFKPGHKIAHNLYMRQDGTRSYFFSISYLAELFTKAGFEIISNYYIHRKTVNIKEELDVPRIFLQGKFRKPEEQCCDTSLKVCVCTYVCI
ncbi:hypothetical protein AAG570_010824 [Ranatra chinensis]|uniref:tRNA N(3)-methylcytidine methyltransferase n=1 Tax=Ranatra chinensis TaxID=642074 RepID=A0ABD0YIU0_9HEMI